LVKNFGLKTPPRIKEPPLIDGKKGQGNPGKGNNTYISGYYKVIFMDWGAPTFNWDGDTTHGVTLCALPRLLKQKVI